MSSSFTSARAENLIAHGQAAISSVEPAWLGKQIMDFWTALKQTGFSVARLYHIIKGTINENSLLEAFYNEG